MDVEGTNLFGMMQLRGGHSTGGHGIVSHNSRALEQSGQQLMRIVPRYQAAEQIVLSTFYHYANSVGKYLGGSLFANLLD